MSYQNHPYDCDHGSIEFGESFRPQGDDDHTVQTGANCRDCGVLFDVEWSDPDFDAHDDENLVEFEYGTTDPEEYYDE